jgi:hypothetical protein
VGAVVFGIFVWVFVGSGSKQTVLLNTLSVVHATTKLLPIDRDTKDVIETANAISHYVLQEDGVTRTYLLLLQNNYELRPGGGFLGQYAIVDIKDGEVTKIFFEDANLLDQRITTKVPTPYPFRQMMSLKNWKFRDSNFSPHFPENVEKAQYFYRLSGGYKKFDGVIAVNADVLNHVLEITGPIQVPGYSPTFTSEDGAWDLEEVVEKAYLGDDIPAEVKEQRKDIMKKMAVILVDELMAINNIPKLVEFARVQMEEKNVMVWFEDEAIQSFVETVHWDGSIVEDWQGDYLMAVDANMGALKSDYYIERSIDYTLDVTGDVPIATFLYTYKHTASYGDWRTSDYHSYLRLYVPQGSVLLEREMVGYPITREEFGKTYFGAKVDVLIGGSTKAKIVYQLPDRYKNVENYSLLLQKQSGVKEIPFRITVKTPKEDFVQEGVLKKDATYTLGQE